MKYSIATLSALNWLLLAATTTSIATSASPSSSSRRLLRGLQPKNQEDNEEYVAAHVSVISGSSSSASDNDEGFTEAKITIVQQECWMDSDCLPLNPQCSEDYTLCYIYKCSSSNRVCIPQRATDQEIAAFLIAEHNTEAEEIVVRNTTKEEGDDMDEGVLDEGNNITVVEYNESNSKHEANITSTMISNGTLSSEGSFWFYAEGDDCGCKDRCSICQRISEVCIQIYCYGT